MRYFLDTEFIEYPCTIDLISVGIVSEGGRELYLWNSECDYSKTNDWVKENVLKFAPPKTDSIGSLWLSKNGIANAVSLFVSEKPEFWGYYADYDWVVFCWLFGTMMDLPDGWPKYCRDIKQLCDSAGNPDLPQLPDGMEHNALTDAWWNRGAYEYLTGRWSLSVADKTAMVFPTSRK